MSMDLRFVSFYIHSIVYIDPWQQLPRRGVAEAKTFLTHISIHSHTYQIIVISRKKCPTMCLAVHSLRAKCKLRDQHPQPNSFNWFTHAAKGVPGPSTPRLSRFSTRQPGAGMLFRAASHSFSTHACPLHAFSLPHH